MKQRDLIKKLEDGGFVFERHGSNHDVYVRGTERESLTSLIKWVTSKPLKFCLYKYFIDWKIT